MMETKNWKQIIVLVGGILVGIVTGTIITAHHFGKMGGRAFPEFIFCATAGASIAGIIKYLVDKRRGINTHQLFQSPKPRQNSFPVLT